MKQAPKRTEVYPIRDALAAAIAVYNRYGFVRRNHGYYDSEQDTYIADSKTIVINTLRSAEQRQPDTPTVVVTDQHREEAAEMFTFFDQKTIMGKLADTVENFDQILIDIFKKSHIDINRDMSVIASLPNSMEIENRRHTMNEFFRSNRAVGSFVGKPKQRLKIAAQVKDVKWIPKRSVYLVTGVTDQQQIIKFFIKEVDTDMSEKIRDQRITFVGTVREQQVSAFTQCHETMFNRVKLDA